jgi:hypothetical protein
MIEFPGEVIHSPGYGEVWIPTARIRLVHGGRVLVADVLVDSGAFISILPYTVGAELGLVQDLTDQIEQARGFGGSSVSYVLRRLRMHIGPHALEVRVGWAQTEETFVVGRLDVFDRFDVEFQQHDRRLTFRPVS